MIPQITLDDQTLRQLQQTGELRVQEAHGVPVVLMTLDARQQLEKTAYDADEWTREEMLGVAAEALDDPEGWGAPGMDEYDKVYGNLFQTDGENQ